jgi:hypothetical protein
MKTTHLLLLATFALTGLSGSASAQGAVYQQAQDDGWVPVKHLEFTDDDVEGGLLGPDGELIMATERAHHPSLIEIREGFEAELIKTMEDQ